MALNHESQEQQIIYRPFVPTDFDQICSLVARVWHADGSYEESFLSGHIDASYFLSVSKFLYVAEKNGAVVGLIFAGDGMTYPENKSWRIIEVSAQDVADTEIESDYFQLGAQYIQTETELIDAFRNSDDPRSTWEVTLLCIDPHEQGKGIGGRLFALAIDYFRTQHASGFFLATDDSCDVDFYDYKGLEQISSADVFPDQDNSVSAYIYAMEL